MSEINPRSMEVHLLKICERIIRLDDYESDTNTKHLNNICAFLFEEMKENNEMFNKLFQAIVPAGSYPDDLKISQPDEYDLLIVLKFPSPSVERSRPGYVMINISKACQQDGWVIDNVDYEGFVDNEGYLIQNKVLDWIRAVVRSTLTEHDNVIETDKNSYEVYQSSNGPAVTLDVTVQSDDTTFSIDFVGCLEFHSDECWMSDVRKSVGVWNAIPKPIKMNDNVTIQQRIDSKDDIMDQALLKASNKSDKISALDTDDGIKIQKKTVGSQSKNGRPGKAKRPPHFLRYKHPKSTKIYGNNETVTVVDSPNSKSRSQTRYSRLKKPSVDIKSDKLNVGAKVHVEQKSKWEKSFKEDTSDPAATKCRRWYRRKTKQIKSEDKVVETAVARSGNPKKPSLSVGVMDNQPIPSQKINAKVMDQAGSTGEPKRKSMNRKRKSTKDVPEKKPKVREVTITANPQKNREWICSYASIERELLRGTHTMKPLIRIFKKIRDHKQLTNLKSYYIKTIFLHHNEKNGIDYWKQSLAVLFMEMFDVVLNHLSEQRLDSFWHKNFNLLRSFREGQIMAIYNNFLRMKNDLISDLEDDNPEFIYELVCTEEERSQLDDGV
ncbi:uncharacterized protein LOC119078461 [Bradysia coprophila]|uniref:uncharacterized protein LOC119078461 n=1 Tax=Bradysia coprophila TaxID=38358 RepID=UPI00187DB512|nr:uncharacterized protein LOC119078461 [Bradysia coprophila]